MCFIEPSFPYIRKWFKKIPTQATIEKLIKALEDILQSSGKVTDFRVVIS
jgi:hypothetical protein